MGCEDNGGNGKANNCKFNDVKWSSISSSVGIGEGEIVAVAMAQSNILQATSFLVEPDQQSTIDTLVKNTSYYSTDTDTDDTVEKKKEVTEYAKKHGRNSAARHFKIDRTMIGRWVKASNKWDDKVSNNSKRIGSGQKAHYPDAEKQLYAWICDQKDQATKLTHAKIQAKMHEILKQSEMEKKYPNALNNFKGSARWVMGFLKRNNLPICRKSKFQKARTKVAAESFNNFRKNVVQLRLQYDFITANMFNMDKVPVWFDESGNMVINSRRKRITHNDTIGTQMPPGETVPNGVLVWFQENGVLTTEHLKNYVDILHCMRMVKDSNAPALFVHNSYNGRLEDSVISKFQCNNFQVAVIPEGLTGVCQPLNVIVLRSFKENLRKEWQNWKNASPPINLQAKITEVCGWVKNAWDEVSSTHIVNAFKRCLISNPLDGAENDKIFEELDILNPNDSDHGGSHKATTSNPNDSDGSQDASEYYLERH
ncbi:11731_t:CDS:2 [Entrophospora sp. SA101]|nr:11731_t:CDS:2 [Entrophospora sp. SA101]